MKRYIYLLMFCLLFSCSEDFITKKPEQSLDSGLALGTVENLRVALNGAYNGLQDADYYGRNFILIPDVMGEDVEQSATNSNRLTLQFRYEMNPNMADALNFWSDAYDVLNRVNSIIQAAPGAAGDETLKDEILAEAYTVRAMTHFDLVRYFAQPYILDNPSISAGANGDGGHLGIPIVTAPLLPDAKPSRNTVKEVYEDLIIPDFLRAIDLFDGTSTSKVYLTKEAAQALLARVYLYKEEWQAAEGMATTVINSGRFTLLEEADYLAAWDNTNPSSESIFEVAFNNSDFLGTNSLGYMYSPDGYYDMHPTGDLDAVLAEISDPAEDVRAELWDTAVPIATKYKGPNTTAGFENSVVIRLSEIYLIRAEARAEQGKFAEARADLDLLRSKRGIGPSAATNPELIEDIILERRLELAFEGHRLWDITRRGMNLVRNDCRLDNNSCMISFPSTMFVQPIPQNELDVNPNIEQNEGYQ